MVWTKALTTPLRIGSLARTIMSAASASASARPASKPSNLVMQIVLPRSLVTKEHNWPVGPLMAQSAHAATAVLHENADTPEVKEYLTHLQGMRKTVMEVPDEAALRSLAQKLDELDPRIPYHLWIEQPENTPTALALAPNKRPKALKAVLDAVGCQLWR